MNYKVVEIPDLYIGGSGYLNMEAILAQPYTFIIIVALRGGGKTYGALSWMLDNKKRFLYFRRTRNAAEIAATAQFNLFKKLNADKGYGVETSYNAKLGVGTFTREGETVGYITSLSTFSALRSIDGSDLDFLLLDEFIPQPEEPRRYDAFVAWSNADETINRNREADGGQPARRLLMANSDQIYGDIIAGYDIGDAFLWMQETGTEAVEISKDMLILRPGMKELMERKKDTSLYRVTAGTDFQRVALENEFRIEDRERIRKQPLNEYQAFCRIRGITFYKHKTLQRMYVTRRTKGRPKTYADTDSDFKRFLNENPGIWPAYLNKRMIFEDLGAQQIFLKMFS